MSRPAGGVRPAGWLALGSWVLFDWAAQPFFTLVTTFVYGPYFATRLAADPIAGQALWGYATAAAGIAIALLSPALGAVADAAGGRKPWILAFSVALVFASWALWFGEPGAPNAVIIALVAFAIGTIAAEFATVFTNAMMPDLVPRRQLGRLSGIGWATGYAGGLVSLVVVLGFLAADPETGRTLLGVVPLFGLDPATFAGDRSSGPFTALWYAVFVLPLFLFTPDVTRRMALGKAVRAGMADLAETLRGLRHEANLRRFLLANLAYHDGLVALFAFGGIYAAGTFGWSAIELGLFGIFLTITGTAGALVGGWLDDRFGSRAVIAWSLAVLIVSCVLIVSIDPGHILFVVPVVPPGEGLFASAGEQMYMALGGVIGAVAGPLQASSRVLMAQLAPPDRMTQAFGLFALSGKVTSFAGPLAVAVVTGVAQSQRIGVSAIIAFFAAGLILVRRVAAPGQT